MFLPSSLGKRGETPILLDPVDQAVPNLWISIVLHYAETGTSRCDSDTKSQNAGYLDVIDSLKHICVCRRLSSGL
jgi:hypothetical protein